ncbi:hypothetical protein ACP4OV_011133 [Aristida adscensionis]
MAAVELYAICAATVFVNTNGEAGDLEYVKLSTPPEQMTEMSA